MFSLEEDYLLVGNGAAELIDGLGRTLRGKLSVSIPAFNEYIRCFRNCEIVPIPGVENDFQMDVQQLCEIAGQTDILAIINPDNPSGSFLPFGELVKVLDACREHHTICIVDESFVDFADRGTRYTLLKDDILEKYSKLIVIKSISKSYGVPGLRLGVLASSDINLIATLRENLPIWNINSFAEYFLQVFSFYKEDYRIACEKIAEQRALLQEKLSKISYLKVYPSQANYIMCQITKKYRAKELATRLISEYELLIKDLSEKSGFDGKQFIRVAVKNEDENDLLYRSLKELDGCGEKSD